MNDYRTWQCIAFILFIFLIVSVFSIIHIDNKKIRALQNQIVETKIECFKKYVESQNKRNLFENVTITAYNPFSNQTDNTPNETAIMETPVPGWTCAVSRDMIHLLNKKIYIEGIGVFVVNDVMNKRFTKRIDICMGNKEKAISFGKKNSNVVVLGQYTDME